MLCGTFAGLSERGIRSNTSLNRFRSVLVPTKRPEADLAFLDSWLAFKCSVSRLNQPQPSSTNIGQCFGKGPSLRTSPAFLANSALLTNQFFNCRTPYYTT